MAVLLTRPIDDSRRLAVHLEQLGHEVLVDPVLEIDHLPVPLLEHVRYQAVLVTSRHAVAALKRIRAELPVFCVGDATAERARRAGCRDVRTGPGDGLGLARTVATCLHPSGGPLLHLSGSEVREEPGERLRAEGFEVERIVTYRARPASSLRSLTIRALEERRIRHILLFSPRAASVFMALAGSADLSASSALCLSPNVAAAVDPKRLVRVLVATQPEEKALLDLLEAPGHR